MPRTKKAPKKHSRKRLKPSVLNDLKSLGLKLRSFILRGFNSLLDNAIGKINLLVSLYLVYQVSILSDQMKDITSSIIAASMSAYVNTMVMFSAVSSELESLLRLFSGSGS